MVVFKKNMENKFYVHGAWCLGLWIAQMLKLN